MSFISLFVNYHMFFKCDCKKNDTYDTHEQYSTYYDS